jgi:hypothetical protein
MPELFNRLMAANREAFDAGHYEAAFHALQAALHLADDAGDEGTIRSAQRAAREPGAGLDARAPDHRMGSRHAAEHGGRALLEPAALHAEAMLSRLPAARAMANSQALRDEG